MNTTRRLPDFSAFPRHTLLDGPTPIRPLDRLNALHRKAWRGARIHVKRDDLNVIGGGGNKLRKLEFLLGEALADGADTVVTVGARQSNHARLTAAAAARAGLRCELVLTRTVPREDADYADNGNIVLDAIFGARVHDLPAGANALDFAHSRAAALRAQGRRVSVFPTGGSSPTGCLGYAACAAEILTQGAASGVAFERIVVPNGSGGTHAGLAAGLAASGADPRQALGYTVFAPAEQARATTLAQARATLEMLSPGATLSAPDIDIDGAHLGPDYGVPTAAMVAAVHALARAEALLTDPVYGGKALAGLFHDLAAARFAPDADILFIMTGGIPGLYAYREVFRAQ
jgi:L-cysteate sulfo-lyase